MTRRFRTACLICTLPTMECFLSVCGQNTDEVCAAKQLIKGISVLL